MSQQDYEYENDGYATEAGRSEANLQLWSAVDCEGLDCGGWILSNSDSWVRCQGAACGGRDCPDPEVASDMCDGEWDAHWQEKVDAWTPLTREAVKALADKAAAVPTGGAWNLWSEDVDGCPF